MTLTRTRGVTGGILAFAGTSFALGAGNASLYPSWLSIAHELSTKNIRMEFLLVVSVLACALGQMPCCYAARRWGVRSTLTLSLGLWSASGVLLSSARDLETMVAAVALQGVATATATPAAGEFLAHRLGERGRGLASAAVAVGGRLGQAMALGLTGWLIVACSTDSGPGRPPLTGNGWRLATLFYGAAGAAACVVTWLALPRTAHVRPVDDDDSGLVGWWLLADRDAWLYFGVRLFAGYGWVFLLGWICPAMIVTRGVSKYSDLLVWFALPFGLAAIGAAIGGVATDRLAARHGRRWGRAGPIGVSMLTAAGLTLSCLWLPAGWLMMAAACAAACCQDVGTPALWAYAQDRGGRRAAVLMAWGNVAGCLGTVVWPLSYIITNNGAVGQELHLTGASAYAMAGVCALLLDPDRRVHDADDD